MPSSAGRLEIQKEMPSSAGRLKIQKETPSVAGRLEIQKGMPSSAGWLESTIAKRLESRIGRQLERPNEDSLD